MTHRISMKPLLGVEDVRRGQGACHSGAGQGGRRHCQRHSGVGQRGALIISLPVFFAKKAGQDQKHRVSVQYRLRSLVLSQRAAYFHGAA